MKKQQNYLVKDFSRFIITGKLTSGKKFRLVTSSYFHANGINLYSGRVWGELVSTGKRVLLKRVGC